MTTVTGYPSKLVIYQLRASRFWWVRYYSHGKIARKSTKAEQKAPALAFAKLFYEDCLLRARQGLAQRKQYQLRGLRALSHGRASRTTQTWRDHPNHAQQRPVSTAQAGAALFRTP
jgi:hypothetical protein